MFVCIFICKKFANNLCQFISDVFVLYCGILICYYTIHINGPYSSYVSLDDLYAVFLQIVLTYSHVINVQVHRAVLHNGERVAVKVQRPGLKKLFDIDLSKIHICYWCS